MSAPVLAFFYVSDVAQLAMPLDTTQSLARVLATIHAVAVRGHLESYQLFRLNYGRPHTPITVRTYLEHTQ